MFKITGLPPGDFVLCARVPNRDVMDPCFWGVENIVKTIRISSRQTSTGHAVALDKARRLDVTVRDAQRLLVEKAVSPGGAKRQALYLVLTGPVGSRPVILQTTRPEPDGQGYDVVIPATGTVRMRVAVKGLQVVDGAGRDVAAGATPVETVLDGFAGSTLAVKAEFRILGRSLR